MFVDPSKVEEFIRIFSIPLEEGWHDYRQSTSKDNYIVYMIGNQMIPDHSINSSQPITITPNPGLYTYLYKSTKYFECEHYKNKVVIDVGCGFGFLSFWFLIWGAAEVIPIGFPFQIEFIEKLYKRACQLGLLKDTGKFTCLARPIKENDTSLGGMEHNIADYINYCDVFEHLPEKIFSAALISSFHSLKKGGKLLSTCHNSDNPKVLNELRHGWDRMEQSSLIEFRKRKIAVSIPGIPDNALDQLGRNTRGLLKEEFTRAVEQFRTTGIIPPDASNKPAIDIENDYIFENYISPPEVIDAMNRAGFKVYCRPAIRHSKRFMPFWPVEKLLGSLLMKLNYLNTNVLFTGVK